MTTWVSSSPPCAVVLALDLAQVPDEVRSAIAATNANRPKGTVEEGDRQWQIYANDQAKQAAEYLPLIVAYRNGAAVRLSEVAEVVEALEQGLRIDSPADGRA